MQIKNILLAAFFVATSQLSCVDEQTDIKAKLQAELDAKCEMLSNLSKKIIEQEVTYKVLTNKIHESFIKYADWLDKKDIENNVPARDAAETKKYFTQRLNILQCALSESIKSDIKMQNVLLDEEYRKDNEVDHELFIYHILMAGFDAQELNILIAKWKVCLGEIMNLEQQLDIA